LISVPAYAATSETAPLERTTIERREPGPRDVDLEILFCGVCHSDLHYTHGDWAEALPPVYPCVPGHEIVGRVLAVGSEVSRYEPGDLVGVGCLVGSDRTCPGCQEGLEQLCPEQVMTYGSPDPGGAPTTYGGYSKRIVVDEHFVLRIPENLDPAGAAPLLCAGITTYSPLKRNGVGPGKKVAIAGLGGLGHMGVKIAKALGAHVSVLTRTDRKREDALRLGADEVVVTGDPAQLEAHAGAFDFILDTISADHDIATYLNLLTHDGNLTLVGAPAKALEVPAFSLIMGRRSLSGSLIGGLAETQEMLDFCGEHGLTADVEVIPIHGINEAWDRLERADVKYRFAIDMASLEA
jgi:uncharacterized zinc-type alcohol dehydrogenase-like protein